MKTLITILMLSTFAGMGQNNQFIDVQTKYHWLTGLNLATTFKADFYSGLSIGVEQEYSIFNRFNTTQGLIGYTHDDYLSIEAGVGMHYSRGFNILALSLGARVMGSKGMTYTVKASRTFVSFGIGIKLVSHNELNGWKIFK